MKLEIKHLAVYAPYNIKVLLGNTKRDLTAISLDSPFVFVTAFLGSRDKQMAGIENIKPVLRHKTYLNQLQDEIFIRWGGGVSKESKGYWLKGFIDNLMYTAYPALRLDEIEFMAEYHIDIFDLINQGLAVSE
jgi:hypothetical protein